ncbi:MAG: hypothetical protein PVF82_16710 [Gammaproteobacteria bacterium]|jgi:hypothetical protein
MDTTYWKTDDENWVKSRKENWPVLEKWLSKNLSSDDCPELFLKNAELYYFEGKINEIESPVRLSVFDYFALHPQLTIEIVRELIDFLCERNYQYLKGTFSGFYKVDVQYKSLIAAGVIEKSLIDTIFIGCYGNSYVEASRLREFEPKTESANALYDVFESLGIWLRSPDRELFPAKLLLPHVFGALEYLTEEAFPKCEFYMKQFAKRLDKFDVEKLSFLKEQCEFVPLFKEALESNKDKLIQPVREVFGV